MLIISLICVASNTVKGQPKNSFLHYASLLLYILSHSKVINNIITLLQDIFDYQLYL